MTPAINQLKKLKINFSIHEYEHDPNCTNFGEEAAEKLNIDANNVFKTLLVSDDKQFFVAIVPVTGTLNLKRAAAAFKVKKLRMADPKEAERLTGYLVGGISPIGQKKSLTTCIDDSAQALKKVYVSGGKRGLDIGLAPIDLSLACRKASFANIRDKQ
ncbi:Cys-tRNA(Pro)/Cys-tRNA(Cys) deacylase YbaK [Marinomonas spartinae]|uniref:Cys-tRNA(Pro) deacylase n=1 Tax=Marinomonas spartinae TaxID=1792290 RepID=UPI000808E40E|nr:Cys-tRNA(Pro) deacylase [Marinomonas spartinae]SBS24853.1 Cys-tRNA(Pro)/Cys-tRNA(Cys) deacylase YbaK [Marinomonas spartinae]